jgi:hypothetical protein
MTKTELQAIIAALVALGEDSREAEFWVEIWDDLEDSVKAKVFQNFTDELRALQEIKAQEASRSADNL